MIRILCALAGALLAATFVFGSAEAAPRAAWVQIVDGGQAQIRAEAAGAGCPNATIDGRVETMTLRARPTEAFPDAICRIDLPKAARHASVEGVALPIPHAHIDRIVIMGDTGCRLKGLAVQACNDPLKWPFATVARRAALERPDLVIHVGDYYYRENACPLNYSGCAGSPHGDAWPTWQAEFFDPAAPLIAAAPWVFARGNHETCKRGGEGWFRLLDAGPAPADGACPAGLTPPFAVPIGEVALEVLDSSEADDRTADGEGVAPVHAQMQAADAAPGADKWIVTHRPVWGLVPVARLGPLGPINVALNATEQAALRGLPMTGVQMIVSGHIHHFASYDFGPERPAQLIVGTGGDIGEAADTATPNGGRTEIDGLQAKSLEFERFGYFIMERAGADWTGAFKDVQGRVVARCRLHARSLICRKAT